MEPNTQAEPLFEVLDPAGKALPTPQKALSPRLASLEGKTVYCISQSVAGADILLEKIAQVLQAIVPGVKAVYRRRTTTYMMEDRPIWDEIEAKADAVIYGCGACGSCSMWGTHWAVDLEKRGIPTAFILTPPFVADVQASCDKEGMSHLRRVVVPHPPGHIGDDLIPGFVQELVDRLTRPLTPEESNPVAKPVPPQPRIAFEGTFDEVQTYFERRGWTEGLPVVPPTERAVKAMLAHTSMAPDHVVVERFRPQGYEVSVEKIATVGVMAGCPPQAMPILVGIVKALSAEWFSSAMMSTSSFSFTVFVNGPHARKIGMNSGVNALGAGTGNRANATIGRFLRLALICLGGSRTGINDMSSLGNPSKYSFAFAENEEASPWEPFHVSSGFKAKENVVTVMSGGWNCRAPFSASMYDVERAVREMGVAISQFDLPSGALLMLDPIVARRLAESGRTKAQVEHEIWSHATRTAAEFRGDYMYPIFIEPAIRNQKYGGTTVWPLSHLDAADDERVTVYPPGAVRVVVVGGATNPFSQAWQFARPTSVAIDAWM